MMDQGNWTKLREEFDNKDNFNEAGWYTANDGYPPFSLEDWLECSTMMPAWRMMDEFEKNGYHVYAGERDSFGWLIGVVEDKRTGRKMTFG